MVGSMCQPSLLGYSMEEMKMTEALEVAKAGAQVGAQLMVQVEVQAAAQAVAQHTAQVEVQEVALAVVPAEAQAVVLVEALAVVQAKAQVEDPLEVLDQALEVSQVPVVKHQETTSTMATQAAAPEVASVMAQEEVQAEDPAAVRVEDIPMVTKQKIQMNRSIQTTFSENSGSHRLSSRRFLRTKRALQEFSPT